MPAQRLEQPGDQVGAAPGGQRWNVERSGIGLSASCCRGLVAFMAVLNTVPIATASIDPAAHGRSLTYWPRLNARSWWPRTNAIGSMSTSSAAVHSSGVATG